MTASPEFEAFAQALAGQYALDREIGRGGMGIVYLGRDLKLDRPVAIKTLPPHLANDAQIRERFLREARTAARLSHPNIVPVYRADEIDGHVFFAMGFVDGISVAERVQAERRIDARVVLREMRDVASALGYANAQGVIHRDVKAENILIERDTGRAMVTDFGIARLAEAAPLTATGQVLGTVFYMSPEQVTGEPLDGRSDLYSLGVVGYYSLTGRFPFDALMASAVLVAQVNKAPPPVLTVAPSAPRALAEIIDRCLAKDPAARFASGDELADALSRVEGEVARDAVRAAAEPTAPAVVSEDEAQAIWNRAAALQAQTGLEPRPAAVARPRNVASDAARTSGFNLAAVRDAALEAGIPAQYVEHAMVEHGLARAPAGAVGPHTTMTDVSPKPSKLLGAPMNIEYEAVIQGETADADFDLFADTIRRRMEQAGAVSAVGRSLTWTSLARQRTVHISVVSRNGKTTIRGAENMESLGRRARIIGLVGGGYLTMGVSAAVVPMLVPHGGLGIGAAIGTGLITLGSVFAAARYSYGRSARKRQARLRKVVEELMEQVRESIVSTHDAISSGDHQRLRP
jgi:eukaryotic-like serine/threonine-protein kinase